MKRFFALFFLGMMAVPLHAQLKVSNDSTHLVTASGKPFFWLGDTAWELFHRLTKQEARTYLQNRARKGFTVIQAVALAELDGINTPNAEGHKPLRDNDPAQPNEAYFAHVDYVVNEAARLGLIIAMLPSWGDKWNKAWGKGPEIFTPANARSFGEYMGKRYRSKPIVWVMGGDRDCVEPDDFAIINAMAEGIKKHDDKHLFTFHPQGGKSSSDFFPDAPWIDFHMSQTGHFVSAPNHRFNTKHLAMRPLKPHVDGEPRYEDHPNAFNAAEKGWMDDFDTRQAAYWSMLSGAFGHTYGNHNIWQMYTEKQDPISMARTHWKIALDHPGAFQVGYLRKLFESKAWQELRPDQSVVIGDNPEGAEYVVASVSRKKDLLMAYLPYGRKVVINTKALDALYVKASWFNPRDGETIDIGILQNDGNKTFTPTSVGRGSDWVLVIEKTEPAGTGQVMPLYPGPIPRNTGAPNTESAHINEKGILIVEQVSVPTLTAYLPDPAKANGRAVVVCPGGGYGILAAGHEGYDIARRFNETGTAAFVLKYRLPNDQVMTDKETVPLMDAQRAIQLVRTNAAKWKINRNKVGIMGFSAGGHLASTAGTHFNTIYTADQKTSVRPDFMILVYPVISFSDSVGHAGSRENLLGKDAGPEKINLYSNEFQVTSQTPPAFLVHAKNDDVKVENSQLFHQALQNNNVKSELYLYEAGGHGYGMYNPTSEVRWMDLADKWLAANF